MAVLIEEGTTPRNVDVQLSLVGRSKEEHVRQTIRIIIADDHELVRRGIKLILAEAKDMTVVGEASDSVTLLQEIEKRPCDVVILDINMPGRSGLDVLTDIVDTWPNIGVLVLSMYPEDQYAVRAVRSGAGGYLTKSCSSDELISAIRNLSQGRKHITPTLAEKLVSALQNKDGEKEANEELSPREHEVMRLLAAGKSIKEIALILSLSVKTISTFRHRILTKMNFRNNADVVHYAIKKGIRE